MQRSDFQSSSEKWLLLPRQTARETHICKEKHTHLIPPPFRRFCLKWGEELPNLSLTPYPKAWSISSHPFLILSEEWAPQIILMWPSKTFLHRMSHLPNALWRPFQACTEIRGPKWKLRKNSWKLLSPSTWQHSVDMYFFHFSLYKCAFAEIMMQTWSTKGLFKVWYHPCFIKHDIQAGFYSLNRSPLMYIW